MTRSLASLLALALLTPLLGPSPPAAAGDFLAQQRRYDRVAAAWRDHRVDVRARFDAAGAAWPPRGLFLRAHKREGELELWAAPREGKRLVRVRTLPICAASGTLGPKARAGDGQVPEGFYAIARFNPRSSYHLSLGLDYPNAVDRARAAGQAPGGDIFIHGSCVTIGCLPLEDGPVSWLYLTAVLARDAGQLRLPVHVFPCRMGTTACEQALAGLSADDAEREAFWEELRPFYEAFERDRVVPSVRATAAGYRLDR